ncbi:hypothetical protein PpBr36_01199 [Pyricularia pennisetigena]|nr:hypothetical protein PpBr36_01199 [Pyricularia pennisetigena]TLS29824.1 hypothetical protein PpBr36_01199 [Pyricularia pennisetigena]
MGHWRQKVQSKLGLQRPYHFFAGSPSSSSLT